MPTPFRLDLLMRLTTHLKGIVPANGFTHDLANNVFRGRIYYDENDPIPLVSILEAQEPGEVLDSPRGSTANIKFYELVIQGWSDDDPQNPTDPAHRLVAEVMDRLAALKPNEEDQSTNRILGFPSRAPTIDEMEIGSPVVRPRDELVSAKAFFVLPLTFKLIEDDDNPYSS